MRVRAWIAMSCWALLSCAGLGGTWDAERAAKHLAAGRPGSALIHTERAIERSRARVAPELLYQHVEALRALDRGAEAESFLDYVTRFEASGRAEVRDTRPTQQECSRRQSAAELVLAWGERGVVYYAVGVVAASFEIDANGGVGSIRVIRAQHPAAAWLIIESIAHARISPSRLARRQERAPESLPASLCVWWSFEAPEERNFEIPRGGCIRGFCTNRPGAAHF